VNKAIAAAIGTLLLSSSAAAQQTFYVDDELTITMRGGKGTQFQIIRTLKSGTKLEVLETDEESGYSLARTNGGTEGWVLTRYLTPTPIAKQRLATAEQKLAAQNKEIADLKSRLGETNQSRDTLKQNSSKLENENKKLQQELKHIREVSTNALALEKNNKELREQTIRLETDLQAMEQQNAVLKDRSARDWFITGTGVTILGIIIGLIVPRLRVQRKSKWSEL
jgi:SH3 domain protein